MASSIQIRQRLLELDFCAFQCFLLVMYLHTFKFHFVWIKIIFYFQPKKVDRRIMVFGCIWSRLAFLMMNRDYNEKKKPLIYLILLSEFVFGIGCVCFCYFCHEFLEFVFGLFLTCMVKVWFYEFLFSFDFQ